MKKQIRIALFIFFLPTLTLAQSNVDKVLSEIEKNNTTLLALQKQVEAQKLGNKTGIYLKNPELGFNYLWGTPSGMGNRTDINVKQSFDFPTAYSYKSQIANSRNKQSGFEYQKQRKAQLLEARLICIDLVYTNAQRAEFEKRLTHAQSIGNAYKVKFDKGETNILEFNKAQLFLLNIRKELEMNEIEQNALLSNLVRINGGKPIEFKDNSIQTAVIPYDFEQWYLQAGKSNPVLSWLSSEIEISQKQTKLNSAMSLPKFSAGYMSEKVVGEQFQGVSTGVSIPLWEDKNRVKQAKAQTLALQEIESDAKLQFYNQLKTQHAKAISLQKSAADYRLSLQSFSNTELLNKALDKGEITLIDYVMELSNYYNSVNKVLDAEREMNKSVAELNQYLE